jgi:hypothetical protein
MTTQRAERSLAPLLAPHRKMAFAHVERAVLRFISMNETDTPMLESHCRVALYVRTSAGAKITEMQTNQMHPLRPRSTKHASRRVSKPPRTCIGFASLAASVAASTPYGKLVFTILTAVAELERSLIAERIRNGMRKQGARKPGRKVGPNGPCPSTVWRRNQKR